MIRSCALLLCLSPVVSCAARYATHREPACPPAQARTRYAEEDSLAGVIAGVVLDRDSGRPLGKSRIQVTSPNQFTTSDSIGVFYIRGLTPGQLLVTVIHVGYEHRTDTVTVRAGRGVHAQIALTPAAIDRCMEVVETRNRRPW